MSYHDLFDFDLQVRVRGGGVKQVFRIILPLPFKEISKEMSWLTSRMSIVTLQISSASFTRDS